MGAWVPAFADRVQHYKIFSGRRNRQPKIHSPGCQTYCNINSCSKPPVCGQCAEVITEASPHTDCQKRPKCASCHGGKHSAASNSCPLRPTVNAAGVCRKPESRARRIRAINDKRFWTR